MCRYEAKNFCLSQGGMYVLALSLADIFASKIIIT